MWILRWCSAFLFLLLVLPPLAVGQSPVTFDFDSGTPALSTGQSIPLDQTSSGLTARFSSPSGPAFGVQSDASTGWKMSRFSGKYLSATSVTRSVLSISFNQRLAGISVTFATADLEIEKPSSIELTAYLDSNTTAAVGSVSVRGAYVGDTLPVGTLTFNSGSRPFNLVEITVPFQAGGATSFVVDNIRATPFSPATSSISSHVSAASYASGTSLAPGMIASIFGQGLAAGMANTTVKVKDSAGNERDGTLFYAGPTQINYLVPEQTAAGPATVTITSEGQVTASGAMSIEAVSPGIFTANFDGKGAPAAAAIAVAPDLTQTTQDVARCGTAAGSCVAAPIDLGPAGTQVILVLYGTGIRGRSSLAAVTAKIAGVDASVQYAGAQPQYAGLDQVNLAIPRALAGRGEVDLLLTADGKAANTVRVNVK